MGRVVQSLVLVSSIILQLPFADKLNRNENFDIAASLSRRFPCVYREVRRMNYKLSALSRIRNETLIVSFCLESLCVDMCRFPYRKYTEEKQLIIGIKVPPEKAI